MIRITLYLTVYFKSMLGIEEVPLELNGGATVGDAIRIFLEKNPDYVEILEKRKTFLFEKLRAIYTIEGKAVGIEHQLNDGDTLKVLKAFIGG